jgi:thiol:disulfide interchange protein DsbA
MSKLFSFFLALAVAAPLASAQPSKYQYTELKPPQPTEAQGKSVEVVEFFWYGCPHCYNLEPLIESWTKKLPPDVQFRRIPAVFNPRWAHDAAIFYTFEAMGVLDKLHKPFFDSIHRDHLRSDDQQAMTEWLQKNGVDAKKFYETMKSFSVQSKTRRAAQLSAAYKIDGTPAMAVQGRFTVSADQGRSREGMLDTVSYLVDMLRQGRL